jgi:hypothetical protein
MDIKQMALDTAHSAKFKGITFSGGLDLAPDNTLDVNLQVNLGGNVDLPGDSEITLMAVLNRFGLGNFSKTFAAPAPQSPTPVLNKPSTP